MIIPNLPAHLILTEMALKRVQKTARIRIRKTVGDAATQEAKHGPLPNKAGSFGRAAVLFGVSQLARRSVPGALLVGGGFLAKTLLERRGSPAATKNED